MGNKQAGGSCCREERSDPYDLSTEHDDLKILVAHAGRNHVLRVPRRSLQAFADFDAALRRKLAAAGVPCSAASDLECFDGDFQKWVILSEDSARGFKQGARSVELRLSPTNEMPAPAPVALRPRSPASALPLRRISTRGFSTRGGFSSTRGLALPAPPPLPHFPARL